MKMRLLALLAILLAPLAHAQTPTRLCRWNETAATCAPPATYRFAPGSFVMPIRFVGEVRVQNAEIRWAYAKAGEPVPACTPAQMAEKASYGFVCRAKIGDVIGTWTRFRAP